MSDHVAPGRMRLNVHLPGDDRPLAIQPSDRGRPLTELLRRHGLALNARCGGRGLCRGCTVLVAGVELKACELLVHDSFDVAIPQRALLGYAPQVIEDYQVNVPVAHDPLVPAGELGVAVDVGTTTVVAQIIDPETGAILGRASAFNAQTGLGDDVVTRINLCMTDAGMISEMQRAVVERTLRPLVAEALAMASEPQDRIGGFAISGNTTMLHLLAGVDPSPMGTAPFQPVFLHYRRLSAGDIGLQPSDTPVHLLPGAAAYIGADLTSGCFATGLLYDEGAALLVDVGTNGEIILKSNGRILGCATAAGPAFEGSGLASGMRATEGAIAHIQLSDDLTPAITVIGDGRPAGLCGTAYVDFLGEAVRTGLLSRNGRFARDASSMRQNEYGKAFAVARGFDGRELSVTEQDVALLLQAKAAIASGILTLLDRARLIPSEVRTLHLAGGFGRKLRLESAVRCGLLPGFRPSQIELVGNTSLAGATLALLDRSVIDEMDRAGRGMEVVELNLDPGFEERYIDCLTLG